MMIPSLSAPVDRRALIEPAQRQVATPGIGEPEFVKQLWELVPGANPNPNDPQRFLDPVPCENWCSLFSGFSFGACLARCRG
jgi:hypothetical protein